MKGIAFVMLALLAAGDAHAATPVKKVATQKVEKPWIPEPYPETGVLPPGYSGLDYKRVLDVFRRKSSSLENGEFETTDDYNKRVASNGIVIAPFSSLDNYAFEVMDVQIKYDADKLAYVANKSPFCIGNNGYGRFGEWSVCTLGKIRMDLSYYVGSNAYGASAKITKIRGENFGFAVPKNSKFFDTAAFIHGKYDDIDSPRPLNALFPVSLDIARVTNKGSLAVFIIGSFSGNKIIDGKVLMAEPTITEPTDLIITTDAIIFTPSKLVMLNTDTGRVMSEIAL